jgi:hypothetical protein
MANTQKSATGSNATDTRSAALSDEELAALKETVKERKTAARRSSRASKEDGESDVLAKIAEMPKADRVMAERFHALVKTNAPDLSPRTWYGMPAYTNQDGKNVCFFQAADKFKARYATFGFEEAANLDDGNMWPTAFALKKLTPADEARISALIKKAVS